MAYIDVDKLIDKINSRIKNTMIRGWLASIINETITEQPTADVEEVVRCKDCAYRRVPTRCSLWMGTTGENEYFREHGDNFYCAFGTPKERGGSE